MLQSDEPSGSVLNKPSTSCKYDLKYALQTRENPMVTVSSKLSPSEDILNGNVHIRNHFFDFQQKKMKFNIVMAIYTFGVNTSRYHITEKIFKHYKIIQDRFQKYVTFSFTIIGSEKEVSRSLTLKYFSVDSYYELDQNATSPDPEYIPDLKIPKEYEIIRKKVNFGMKTAFHKDDCYDIIFWVGSNDYISLNFWRQVIEDYNPKVLKWYGLGTYFFGRNVAFYTEFDGKNLQDRNHSNTFFHNGKMPRYTGYRYIGPVNGITRTALKKHNQILKFWNHDEGDIERFVFRQNEKIASNDSSSLIHAFSSSECFTMNIKMRESGQDATPFHHLKNLFTMKCNYRITEIDGLLSPLFWSNFDQEYTYFNGD